MTGSKYGRFPNGEGGYKIADKYDDIWEQGLYSGFSAGTSHQNTTPLLEELIKKLNHERKGLPVAVIEGGAGAGHHAIRLAQEDSVTVYAVEYSPAAALQIKSNILDAWAAKHNFEPLFGEGSTVKIVNLDLGDYIRSLITESRYKRSPIFDAFYSNAVFHFLTPDEREKLYSGITYFQPEGGLVAVSFKADGDCLQGEGKVISKDEYGTISIGNDGIQRLFVSNPKEIMDELINTRPCYSIVAGPILWSVQGYNLPGKDSRFIGFIGEKK